VKTLKELARDALQVQDAVNLSGVVRSFGQALTDLREIARAEGWEGTEALNTHPIAQLWASKIHSLARMGLSDADAYGRAYIACQELAGA